MRMEAGLDRHWDMPKGALAGLRMEGRVGESPSLIAAHYRGGRGRE